jgi:hypothetical protein
MCLLVGLGAGLGLMAAMAACAVLADWYLLKRRLQHEGQSNDAI